MAAVAVDIISIVNVNAEEKGAIGDRDKSGYRRLWVGSSELVCFINALARGPCQSLRAMSSTGTDVDGEVGDSRTAIALVQETCW